MDASDVRDNTEESRFEIWVDGALAGFTTYALRSTTISFLHTEVESDFQGQGVAQRLVTAALQSARERDLNVLPFCPYVREFIARHPEYLDLVPAQDRPRFGLA